jgi:hypothetical protein
MHSTRLVASFLVGWIFLGVGAVSGAEEVEAVRHYHDEESGRIVRLDETDPAKVRVQVRFPGDPGFFSLWQGEGLKEGKEVIFSRILGEDEAPGAKFFAKGGGRLEIGFAPDQTEPADEGFLGEYRRLSEEKRLSLAQKELKTTENALSKAQKAWGTSQDPNVKEWNLRWPVLRDRWLHRGQIQVESAPAPSAPTADEVFALIETTGQAIAFFQQPPPEGIVPPDGSGNYDDGFGGGVTLRVRSDGSYRIGFGWQRGDLEAMGSDFSLDLPAAEIQRVRGSDDWTVDYLHPDPEVPEGEVRARIQVKKSGRFLWVRVLAGTRYTGPGWADGIYRWGPIPVEG